MTVVSPEVRAIVLMVIARLAARVVRRHELLHSGDDYPWDGPEHEARRARWDDG